VLARSVGPDTCHVSIAFRHGAGIEEDEIAGHQGGKADHLLPAPGDRAAWTVAQISKERRGSAFLQSADRGRAEGCRGSPSLQTNAEIPTSSCNRAVQRAKLRGFGSVTWRWISPLTRDIIEVRAFLQRPSGCSGRRRHRRRSAANRRRSAARALDIFLAWRKYPGLRLLAARAAVSHAGPPSRKRRRSFLIQTNVTGKLRRSLKVRPPESTTVTRLW